ncbi:MAG TPA: FGGY family carbohydrate kinase [Thermotogota bacterium]|nr:FGGY family carbohydrate kinase [Thermotogota bacterium]HRW92510.1 FGGY family carbohydrate kinase [Thermotogota bacterium]
MHPSHDYLAIDLGASGGKACLGRVKQTGIELQTVHRFANAPVQREGVFYWDIHHLVQQVRIAVRQAKEHCPSLRSIGIDTWGVDFGLLGREGALLCPPLCYRNWFFRASMERALERVPEHRLFEVTRNHLLPINTVFQLVAFEEQFPELFARARSLLMMPQLVGYLLGGPVGCEFTIASTTGLMDATEKSWSEELIRELGFPPFFAPIAFPGKRMGEILSLPLVHVGSHDTASAFAGTPVSGSSEGIVSTGTWCLVGVEVDSLPTDPRMREWNFSLEGRVDGGFRLLKNIPGLWLIQRSLQEWKKDEPDLDFSRLSRLARQACAPERFVDVNDPSLENPTSMVAALQALCEKTGFHKLPRSPGEVSRLVIESIARAIATAFHQLEQITQRPVQVIRMVGGGTQDSFLCQRVADFCHHTVIAGPVEATSVGNLLCQSIADGRFESLSDARAFLRAAFPFSTYHPAGKEEREGLH